MSEPERTAPESFLLLKFGANVYTKDGKEGGFDFGDASADTLIAEFDSRSRDLVIDFEHSRLTGGPVVIGQYGPGEREHGYNGYNRYNGADR